MNIKANEVCTVSKDEFGKYAFTVLKYVSRLTPALSTAHALPAAVSHPVTRPLLQSADYDDLEAVTHNLLCNQANCCVFSRSGCYVYHSSVLL
jgi:hypothetical protein